MPHAALFGPERPCYCEGMPLLTLKLWCPDSYGLERYVKGYYMTLYLGMYQNPKINCIRLFTTLSFRIQCELPSPAEDFPDPIRIGEELLLLSQKSHTVM